MAGSQPAVARENPEYLREKIVARIRGLLRERVRSGIAAAQKRGVVFRPAARSARQGRSVRAARTETGR